MERLWKSTKINGTHFLCTKENRVISWHGTRPLSNSKRRHATIGVSTNYKNIYHLLFYQVLFHVTHLVIASCIWNVTSSTQQYRVRKQQRISRASRTDYLITSAAVQTLVGTEKGLWKIPFTMSEPEVYGFLKTKQTMECIRVTHGNQITQEIELQQKKTSKITVKKVHSRWQEGIIVNGNANRSFNMSEQERMSVLLSGTLRSTRT